MAEQYLTPDQTSALTRYSLDELRRLAMRGYFPKATSKGYAANKTIQGCFKSRSEEVAQAGGLPTYDSITQAAARTGVPLTIFKQEKRLGSDAFKYNRVNLHLFLKGLFSRGASNENFGEMFKKFQAFREQLRFQEESGETANRGEVIFGINRAMSAMFNLLDRLANIDLPPALKGMNERDIQQRLLASIEQLKKEFKRDLERITAEAKSTKEKK